MTNDRRQHYNNKGVLEGENLTAPRFRRIVSEETADEHPYSLGGPEDVDIEEPTNTEPEQIYSPELKEFLQVEQAGGLRISIGSSAYTVVDLVKLLDEVKSKFCENKKSLPGYIG